MLESIDKNSGRNRTCALRLCCGEISCRHRVDGNIQRLHHKACHMHTKCYPVLTSNAQYVLRVIWPLRQCDYLIFQHACRKHWTQVTPRRRSAISDSVQSCSHRAHRRAAADSRSCKAADTGRCRRESSAAVPLLLLTCNNHNKNECTLAVIYAADRRHERAVCLLSCAQLAGILLLARRSPSQKRTGGTKGDF